VTQNETFLKKAPRLYPTKKTKKKKSKKTALAAIYTNEWPHTAALKTYSNH